MIKLCIAITKQSEIVLGRACMVLVQLAELAVCSGPILERKKCFSVSTTFYRANLAAYYTIYIQGGAVNRGLFFADPLPSPLGAVSGKISENRWAAA
jgi:hypothetical protein